MTSERRPSPTRKVRLSTAVAGMTFAVLYQLGSSGLASMPGAPTGTESDEELARYFADNSGGVLRFAVIVIFSTLFLVWFAYGLRRVLLSIGTAPAAVPGEVIVGAAMVAAAVIVCALLLVVSAGERSAEAILPPDTARALWDLSNGLGVLLVFPAAAFTGAIALVARRLTSLPRWLRVTAPPLAVLLLVVVVGWLTIKLWCIWLIALSISLLRGRHWNARM